MSEVTRYVFEWRDGVASNTAEGDETARRDDVFQGATSKKEGLRSSRDAPPERVHASTHIRTHARTHARIRDVMNVKLNDAPPLLARAGEIAFCFIQEVLIIQCLGIGARISLSTLCFETSREVETVAG